MKPLKDYDNLIFVATMGRSGSRMFINLLNSTPSITMKFEPTLNVYPPSGDIPKEHFESFVSDTDESNNVIGCKFFIQQYRRFNITRDYLMSLNDNVKIIHLCRENILEQFLSMRLAQANNSWVSKTPERSYEIDTIVVDIEDFRKFETYTIKAIDEYKRMFPDDLYVTYKELAESPQTTFDNKIFPHLEVESSPVEFKTFKQNLKSVEDTIENFGEIEEMINCYLDNGYER